MPEMDGFEATAHIRKIEGQSRHTVIIAMTANALKGDKERCLAAGMDDYLPKPIRQADLATAIARWSSSTEAIAHVLQKVNNTEALVDETVLQDLLVLAGEDEPHMIEQLLRMFLQETPGRIKNISRAVEGNDPRTVHQTAHLLKGTSKQLGLIGMAKLCQRLEDRGESHDLHHIETVVMELEQRFCETKEFLESKYSLQEVANENPYC